MIKDWFSRSTILLNIFLFLVRINRGRLRIEMAKERKKRGMKGQF